MIQVTTPHGDGEVMGEKDKRKCDERLGKKLSYLLRYGAEREGLSVCDKGFVKLDDLVEVSLLQRYTSEEVLHEVKESKSFSGKRRYEDKTVDHVIYVRASDKRRMERSAYHEDTKVPRLLESCIEHICSNIKIYSLEDCPDEFLVNQIIHKLKRRGKLTNIALENLLGPYIETLNLEGALITQRAPKIIAKQCPDLRHLNLKGCGYVITDHVVTFLIKRLPELRELNLCGCNHVTGNSLRTFPKHLKFLQTLNLCWITGLGEGDLLPIIEGCPRLERIKFFGVKVEFSDEACVRIAKVCAARPLKVLYDNENVQT